jgi:hypothetical protein
MKNIIHFDKFSKESLINEKLAFLEKLKNSKVSKALKMFFTNIKQEATETKEAGNIIKSYVSGNKISKDDSLKLKNQFYDVLRSVGIGIQFLLIPGASVLIPLILFLSRKMNIELLPSSFRKEENTIIDKIKKEDKKEVLKIVEGSSEQNKIINKIINYKASVDDFKKYWESKLKKS